MTSEHRSRIKRENSTIAIKAILMDYSINDSGNAIPVVTFRYNLLGGDYNNFEEDFAPAMEITVLYDGDLEFSKAKAEEEIVKAAMLFSRIKRKNEPSELRVVPISATTRTKEGEDGEN
jgi:hypothetical protein